MVLTIFFELSCARHYNSGSHWTVLELSLLDNGIKKKGQGQKKDKSKQPPQHTTTKQNHNQSLTNQGEKVKQAQALTAIYNPQLSPRLQQEIVKVQCSVDTYATAVPSSTCFRFFLRHFHTSCWLPTNCNDVTCFSSRTWAYMLVSIPCSPHQESTGGADEAAIVGPVQYARCSKHENHCQYGVHLSYHLQAD